MGMSSCAAVALHVTTVAGSDEQREALTHALAASSSLEHVVDAFLAMCPVEMAELVREELAELPAHTVSTIVNAWIAAETAGKTFELRSAAPDTPLAFARDRRVRIAVDMDNRGVVVSLSHIPGRHADWYAPTRGADSAVTAGGAALS